MNGMEEAGKARRAVLLLAHGTPERVDQVPEYLRNVVGGRPVPDALVQEIQHRYGLIGQSPLTRITLRQAELLAAELKRQGTELPVYVGMRNWHPYIADVLGQMRADGIEEAVVICLAPQNSRTSVGLYRQVVEKAAAGIRIDFTEGWATQPQLIAGFAERLQTKFQELREATGQTPAVLFTAHSVPVRTVQPDAEGKVDPYADEARKTAELVAASLPDVTGWRFAFQSQGAGGGPWLGPTVDETLAEMAAEGVKTVLLQPIGFLCDHVEILYDIDIDFRQKAAQLGMRLERPASLNESACFIQALGHLVQAALNRLARSTI